MNGFIDMLDYKRLRYEDGIDGCEKERKGVLKGLVCLCVCVKLFNYKFY